MLDYVVRTLAEQQRVELLDMPEQLSDVLLAATILPPPQQVRACSILLRKDLSVMMREQKMLQEQLGGTASTAGSPTNDIICLQQLTAFIDTATPTLDALEQNTQQAVDQCRRMREYVGESTDSDNNEMQLLAGVQTTLKTINSFCSEWTDAVGKAKQK